MGDLVKHKSLLLIGIGVVFSTSLFADVTFTVNGTFAANAPVGSFSAPNGVWTLSFQLHNPPAIFGVQANSFDSTPLNAVFTLNGTSIPVTGTEVFFSGGVMNLFLDQTPVQFFLSGPATLFSGPVSNPVLLPGTYTVNTLAVLYNQATITASSSSSNLVIAQTAPQPTPAPSSVIMVSIGLAGLAQLEMLRRKNAYITK